MDTTTAGSLSANSSASSTQNSEPQTQQAPRKQPPPPPRSFSQRIKFAPGVEPREPSKAALKKLRDAHERWVKSIAVEVRNGSTVLVQADGSVVFGLPGAFVNRIVRSLVEQRAKNELRAGDDAQQVVARALGAVRSEVDDQVALTKAYAILKAVRDEQQTQKQEQTHGRAEEAARVGRADEGGGTAVTAPA